jgi:uncharacterized protein with FMN-binding domain
MKKFIVAVIIIGAFILYSLMYSHAAVALPNSETSSGSSSASSKQSSPSVATATPSGTSSTSTPTTTTQGQYKDGSYTSSVADAQWGYIQVKATISGGKLTNVQFLQYPNDRNRSIEINSYADPQLSSEAIQAQSANVDIVTGATDSSEAFIQSLSNALAQAKA